MKLYQVTAKRDYNISGAKIVKNMSVEIPCSGNPFNNGGKLVVAALVAKYGIDNKRLTGLSPNNFEVTKLS